jgi:hypothetical protein
MVRRGRASLIDVSSDRAASAKAGSRAQRSTWTLMSWVLVMVPSELPMLSYTASSEVALWGVVGAPAGAVGQRLQRLGVGRDRQLRADTPRPAAAWRTPWAGTSDLPMAV